MCDCQAASSASSSSSSSSFAERLSLTSGFSGQRAEAKRVVNMLQCIRSCMGMNIIGELEYKIQFNQFFQIVLGGEDEIYSSDVMEIWVFLLEKLLQFSPTQ